MKGFAGRYVSNEGLGIVDQFSPIGFDFDFRSWNDAPFPLFGLPAGNGDGLPINADGTPQFNEVGPSFNPNFGTPVVTNRLDPDARRLSNWQYSGGVEHQLNDEWTVSGMWHHRRYGMA